MKSHILIADYVTPHPLQVSTLHNDHVTVSKYYHKKKDTFSMVPFAQYYTEIHNLLV